MHLLSAAFWSWEFWEKPIQGAVRWALVGILAALCGGLVWLWRKKVWPLILKYRLHIEWYGAVPLVFVLAQIATILCTVGTILSPSRFKLHIFWFFDVMLLIFLGWATRYFAAAASNIRDGESRKNGYTNVVFFQAVFIAATSFSTIFACTGEILIAALRKP